MQSLVLLRSLFSPVGLGAHCVVCQVPNEVLTFPVPAALPGRRDRKLTAGGPFQGPAENRMENHRIVVIGVAYHGDSVRSMRTANNLVIRSRVE